MFAKQRPPEFRGPPLNNQKDGGKFELKLLKIKTAVLFSGAANFYTHYFSTESFRHGVGWTRYYFDFTRAALDSLVRMPGGLIELKLIIQPAAPFPDNGFFNNMLPAQTLKNRHGARIFSFSLDKVDIIFYVLRIQNNMDIDH
jgi:hypothetical protein